MSTAQIRVEEIVVRSAQMHRLAGERPERPRGTRADSHPAARAPLHGLGRLQSSGSSRLRNSGLALLAAGLVLGLSAPEAAAFCIYNKTEIDMSVYQTSGQKNFLGGALFGIGNQGLSVKIEAGKKVCRDWSNSGTNEKGTAGAILRFDVMHIGPWQSGPDLPCSLCPPSDPTAQVTEICSPAIRADGRIEIDAKDQKWDCRLYNGDGTPRQLRPQFQAAKWAGRASCGGQNERAFHDPRNGGECWSCPEGYARTIFPVNGKWACEKGVAAVNSKAKRHAKGTGLLGTDCPRGSGQFWHMGDGRCYSCPAGYNRTLASINAANACSKPGYADRKPAKRHGEAGCPKGSFQNGLLDQCYRCPEGYEPFRVFGTDLTKQDYACTEKI